MNILLFTTEELMLTTIEFRFRKHSWKLIVANDTETTLEKTRKFSPDLVAVDLNVPDFLGLDALQFLRKEFGKTLPILVIGSLDSDSILMEALRLGANDFIIAPYKPDELILRIRRLLKMQSVKS